MYFKLDIWIKSCLIEKNSGYKWIFSVTNYILSKKIRDMIRQSNLTFYKIWNNQNPSETNQNSERIQQEPSWNPPANNQNAQANHQESTWIAGFNAWWILIGSWWFLKKKTIWLKKAFIYRVLKNVKRRESTRTHQNQSKPTRNTPGIHHCVETVFSLKTDRIKKVVTPKKETSEFFGNNWFTCSTCAG